MPKSVITSINVKFCGKTHVVKLKTLGGNPEDVTVGQVVDAATAAPKAAPPVVPERLARFVKMARVGVPGAAVRNKMVQTGMNLN